MITAHGDGLALSGRSSIDITPQVDILTPENEEEWYGCKIQRRPSTLPAMVSCKRVSSSDGYGYEGWRWWDGTRRTFEWNRWTEVWDGTMLRSVEYTASRPRNFPSSIPPRPTISFKIEWNGPGPRCLPIFEMPTERLSYQV